MTHQIKAYHGTHNLASTLRYGIRLGADSRSGSGVEMGVFLTTDMEEAARYSRARWSILGSFYEQPETGGVVEVRIPLDWVMQTEEGYGDFDPDPQIFHDYPREGHVWYVTDRRIPRENIIAAYSAVGGRLTRINSGRT